jgi:bacteriorhodopsin
MLSSQLGAQKEFDIASTMAQTFSGALFTALVLYLIFANSTKMAYIQRASLEKRLSVCCHIHTMVAATSAFLNFFQITEVDNWFMPDNNNYTVDMARPLEWILTCPLLQLCIVLLGGQRIPEYRRIMMPCLAAVVVAIGAATLFVDRTLAYVLYGFGLFIHGIAMYFNRQQIIEHSKGAEGLLEGDSEFRKATLILMGTWCPFPIWYILSPEGAGIVTDIAMVQNGWCLLNIIAKFSLIFYFQRMKDNYCNRLKVRREMKGVYDVNERRELEDDEARESGEAPKRPLASNLTACVVETMTLLGMAGSVERFLRLLQNAQICTMEEVGKLTYQSCKTLQLPYDLVEPVQKRFKVWELEMVDEADKDLEAGEQHYKKKPETANKRRPDDASEYTPSLFGNPAQHPNFNGFSPLNAAALSANGFTNKNVIGFGRSEAAETPGTRTGQSSRVQTNENLPTFSSMPGSNEVWDQVLEQLEFKMAEKNEKVIEDVGKLLEIGFTTQKEQNSQMLQMIEQLSQRVAASQDATQTIQSSLEMETKKVQELRESQNQSLSRLEGSLCSAMDGVSKCVTQEFKATAFTLQTKVDAVEESLGRKHKELEETLTCKMDNLHTKMLPPVVNDGVDSLRSMLAEQTKSCTEQTKLSTEQLQVSIEGQHNKNHGEYNKIDQKLSQLTHEMALSPSKDLSTEFSKHVEVVVGVVGNSLRSQMEGLQALQISQRSESDSMMTAKLDACMGRFQQQFIQSSTDKMGSLVENSMKDNTDRYTSKMNSMLESSIKDGMEKATRNQMEVLKDFQRYVEDATRTQQQSTQDMHSAIFSVKSSAAECVDKVSVLNEQLAFSDADQGGTGNFGIGIRQSLQRPHSSGRSRRTPPTGSSYSHYGQQGMTG